MKKKNQFKKIRFDLTCLIKMLEMGLTNRLGGESVIYRPSYSKGYKPQNPK